MISRRIIAAFALLCAAMSQASAQSTKAQLNAQFGANLPDQNTGAITPAILRSTLSSIVNSIMPTAPVVSGNLACFDGVTGLLLDCGASPAAVGLTVGASIVSGGVARGILFNNGGILGSTLSPTVQTLTLSGVVGTITLSPVAGASGNTVVSVPGANDQLVARATLDTLSNKTFDTAAPNIFKINTNQISAVTGTGNTVPLSVSPVFTGAPNIAAATATSINGNSFPASTYTLSGAAAKILTFLNTMTLSAVDASQIFFGGGGNVTYTIASGALALNTTAVSSAACSTAQTAVATGTVSTDVVTASFNGDPSAVTGYVPSTAGMLTILVYPTPNTANFKVCNNTTATITPSTVTLNWRVLR